MNMITKEALAFLTEAKEQLSQNPEWFTYRDTEGNFIALRTGMFDNCIMVYELGNEVGNFTEQLPRQHKVLIDYDELEKYKKLRENILARLQDTEMIVKIDPTSEYAEGFRDALDTVLKGL